MKLSSKEILSWVVHILALAGDGAEVEVRFFKKEPTLATRAPWRYQWFCCSQVKTEG